MREGSSGKVSIELKVNVSHDTDIHSKTDLTYQEHPKTGAPIFLARDPSPTFACIFLCVYGFTGLLPSEHWQVR